MFVTCFHEFQIHEIVSRNFSFLLWNQGRTFLLRSKMMLKLFISTKKSYFAAPFKKEVKTFFVEKMCGFVASEFVRICLEQASGLELKNCFWRPPCTFVRRICWRNVHGRPFFDQMKFNELTLLPKLERWLHYTYNKKKSY